MTMYRRRQDVIERRRGDEWALYVVWVKGSWCKPGVDSIGQRQLDPVMPDEQARLSTIPERQEVEL